MTTLFREKRCISIQKVLLLAARFTGEFIIGFRNFLNSGVLQLHTEQVRVNSLFIDGKKAVRP